MSVPNISELTIRDYKIKLFNFTMIAKTKCLRECGNCCVLQCGILNMFNNFKVNDENLQHYINKFIVAILKQFNFDKGISFDFENTQNLIQQFENYNAKYDVETKEDFVELKIKDIFYANEPLIRFLKHKFIEHLNNYTLYGKKGCFINCGVQCVGKCVKYDEINFETFYNHMIEFENFILQNPDLIYTYGKNKVYINLGFDSDKLNFLYHYINSISDIESLDFRNTINKILTKSIKLYPGINVYKSCNNDVLSEDTVITKLRDITTLEINKCKKIINILYNYMEIDKELYINKLEKSLSKCNKVKILRKYLQNNAKYLLGIFRDYEESDFKNPEFYVWFIGEYIDITVNPKDRINKKICLEKFISVFFPLGNITGSIIYTYRTNMKKILTELTGHLQNHRDDYWGCLQK